MNDSIEAKYTREMLPCPPGVHRWVRAAGACGANQITPAPRQ